MIVSIIDKPTKRHGKGGLTREDTKLLRHYVAEATDRLYNDLLKRKKPDLVQVEVRDGDGGLSYSTSDESHNCFRIGRSLLRFSPTGQCFNPKLVIAHELVHGVDNIMMNGEYYKMMYAPDVKSEIRHIMLIIYRCRNEGVAVLGEHLMYDEFYPDKESEYYNPYEEIQDRDYYSDVKNASRRLDFFVDFLEQLLRSWGYITNEDFKRKEDDIVYRCDVVLIEAMRALGLISDDVARCYGRGYYLDSLMKEDRSRIMQTALSMTLSQFMEGIFVAFRGKSSLVDRFLSYCVRSQKSIEKDEKTLFTLLAKTRVVKVEEHNRVLEKIVKTQMPDECLEQMVKALHDAPKEQTTPVLTWKEKFSNALDPENVPEYQTNPGALKMIDQLYEYYLQYKDDIFYKDYAQAANWSLNYYFKRDDLIDDDLAFIGRTDDLILLDVTQQMIKREMALDLNFCMNDSGDGLIVILDEDRGDIYIPEWHILDGRLYPVVEVRLGNLQKLGSLYIPEAITSIDMKYISVGSSLSSIKVAENHPRYDSRNNCNAIIETATNKLVLGCKTTEIPFSVTSIGNYAFRNIPQRELRYPAEVKLFPRIELLIPDEVTEIAPDAFEGFEGTIYFRDPSMIENSGGEVISI